jgi:hypothetical protein
MGTGWREVLKMICPTGRAKYFSQEDWTVESALIWFDKFAVWRKRIRRNQGGDFRSTVIPGRCEASNPES